MPICFHIRTIPCLALNLPPLSKVRCCRPIKFGRRPEGLQHLPRPFRFSDTSVNNPSIVGSASHCNRSSPLHKRAKGDTALPTFPKPHYPSKIAIILALLAPPVAPTLSIPTTIEKEQHALASHHHTCLPCQREVDWRQGTNLNIIAFTCDMSTLFILQTFLPSRRRDCHTTNYASHQPLQNRTIPLAFRRGVGLPLPLHQSLLFSLIFVKEHLSLALLAPPETSLQL